MIRKAAIIGLVASSVLIPTQAIAIPSANQVYEIPTTPEGPLPPIPTTPTTPNPPDDSCCEHNPPVVENPPRENPPTVTTPRENQGTLPVTGLDILVILGAAGGAGAVGYALRKTSNRK